MIKGGLAFATALVLLCPQGLAAAVYRFSGEVTRITRDTITVRGEQGEMEFRRGRSLRALPEGIREGDRVTIEYVPEARAVAPGAGRQEPGRSGDLDTPTPVPQEDDRIFYNADGTERGSDAAKNRS